MLEMKKCINRVTSSRKRVRFADEFTSSIAGDVLPLCSYSKFCQPKFLSSCQILRSWYQADDYLQFRIQSRIAVTEALDEGWNSKIASWHGCATTRNISLKKASPEIKKMQAVQMSSWARREGPDCCRGLERFVCPEYARFRCSLRRGQRKAVMYAQNQLKGDEKVNLDQAWLVKAKIARYLSENSVNIAHRIGKADAVAAYDKRVLRDNNAPKTPLHGKSKLQPKTPKSAPTARSITVLSPTSSSYVPPAPLNAPITSKKQETISPSPFISPAPLHFTPPKQPGIKRKGTSKSPANAIPRASYIR